MTTPVINTEKIREILGDGFYDKIAKDAVDHFPHGNRFFELLVLFAIKNLDERINASKIPLGGAKETSSAPSDAHTLEVNRSDSSD